MKQQSVEVSWQMPRMDVKMNSISFLNCNQKVSTNNIKQQNSSVNFRGQFIGKDAFIKLALERVEKDIASESPEHAERIYNRIIKTANCIEQFINDNWHDKTTVDFLGPWKEGKFCFKREGSSYTYTTDPVVEEKSYEGFFRTIMNHLSRMKSQVYNVDHAYLEEKFYLNKKH